MKELTKEEKQLLFIAIENHLDVCAKKMKSKDFQFEVETAKNLLNKINLKKG